MKRLLALITLLIITFQSIASITENGQGMIFGKDHAFTIKADEGWVLDNESGVNQGLHMVFYPKEFSWANSPVISYGRAITSTNGETIKSQVQYTIDDFRKNGSPQYVGEHNKDIALDSGKLASIYFYSGDKWGNYEAVAYVQEAETINFLVYNSRNKEQFDKSINAFYKMVESYDNRYTPRNLTTDEVNSLTKKAEASLAVDGGKEYETKATQLNGQLMSNSLQQCTSFVKSNEDISFSYFVEINAKGNINDSAITPTNALTTCFNGLMSQARYPANGFEDFMLQVSVTITK